MPYMPRPRPLMDWLHCTVLPSHMVEEGFLCGQYVRLYNHFMILSFLYESSVILGCVRRDKLSALEKMPCTMTPQSPSLSLNVR